ncbi:MAG: hypothetical protein V4819_19260 [Verrucomicrobiota bacterium]
METKITRNLKWCLALEPSLIRKLAAEIQVAGQPLSIWTRCSDDATRTFNDVDELLAYPNPSDRKIQRLTLSAGTVITLYISSFDWTNVELEIRGEDDFVITKSDRILRELRTGKPWYSFIRWLNPSIIIIGLGVLIFLAVGLLLWAGRLRIESSHGSSFLEGVFMGVAMMIVFTLVGMFRDKVFPITTFRIGFQETTYQVMDKVRWGICFSVVIGPLAKGIVALI